MSTMLAEHDDLWTCRFGVLNKVVLLFAAQWWEARDTFGHVVDADEEPGWFYLWYCFPGMSGVSWAFAYMHAYDREIGRVSNHVPR